MISYKKVLCVEDDPISIVLLARIVEAEGCQPLRAANGFSALKMMKEAKPDLVLLDINMPGMSGLAVAEQIRADAALAAIPIIATTAGVLVGDKERCLAAGCDAYLPKPFEVAELRRLIRAYLSKEGRTRSPQGNGHLDKAEALHPE